ETSASSLFLIYSIASRSKLLSRIAIARLRMSPRMKREVTTAATSPTPSSPLSSPEPQDTKPITTLQKKTKKEVKVENEDGQVVGVVKEDEEGKVEVDVKEEEEEKVGKRNRAVQDENEDGEVAVEEEVNQTKRPTRVSKRASSKVKYEEEDEDDDEDVKPRTKRPRISRNSSSTLSESLPQTKKGGRASTAHDKKGKSAMSHSVDRDEAEMSGRVWKDLGEGTMHGLDG
ncbi:MAG: hypothetical protein O7C60_07535, partial [Rickettsia endosymbiont of Ixodes persulcatus]|nr:hypothetical protein [Rickettsia endosymbiont of Ixodes persulcatus]